jgi:hypothetical protein
MKKRIVHLCTLDFLNNTSGGGQVFLCNLKTLEKYIDKLLVFVMDFKRLGVETYLCKNGELIHQRTFIIVPRIFFRYNVLILKFVTFLSLSFKYDLIWCEHFYSLPHKGITPGFVFKKIIYSQHDFLFKIKGLMDGETRNKLFLEEKATISKCRFMVAGNQVEVDYAKEKLHSKAFYLPISVENVLETAMDYSPTLIHLGSFGTTASRMGFEHFYHEVIPNIKTPVKTLLIGQNTNDIKFKDICGMGFVDDLGEFLKTGTINIIPWKYDSGQRTRVFQALGRGNVIVSYKVLGKIIPELINLRNCILVEEPVEFACAIDNLLNNNFLRTSIAFEALELARKMTIQNRVEKLKKIIVKSFGE